MRNYPCDGLGSAMEIAGKVVLITGGKRVGASVAEELATRGADIALGYNRSRKEAESAVATVRAKGRRAVAFSADLTRGADPTGRSAIPLLMESPNPQAHWSVSLLIDRQENCTILLHMFSCQFSHSP